MADPPDHEPHSSGVKWQFHWPQFHVPRLVKAIVGASASFVVGALAVAILREPVDHYLVPWTLQLFHGGYVIHLYSGREEIPYKKPGERYALLVPTSTTSISGRMIEITNNGYNYDYDYFVTGTRRADGVLAFNFSRVDKAPGGGAFVGDGSRYNGIYVGSLTGLAHEEGEACQLVFHWAVVGPANQSDRFTEIINEVIKNIPSIRPAAPSVAIECRHSKKAANISD
jgi:hypothetical protein